MPQLSDRLSNDDLITISTVAQILRRPESTVRLWLNRGVFHSAVRTPSGLTLYSRAEVQRISEEHRD